jgi:competence protein ComEC
MSTIIILAICTDRKKSPAPLISFAAIIILIIDPLQLYTVSFQLSFVATISILYIFPVLRSLIVQRFTDNKQTLLHSAGLFKWVLAGLLVSSVATLSTIPVSLYFFHRISLISPVSNLIIEPLICFWSLISGFLALPFIWIFPEFSALLFQAGAVGLKFAENVATFFAHLPFSHLWLPKPTIWHICIYYTGLLILILAGKKISLKSIAAFITLIISFLFFFFPPGFLLKSPHKLQITYLDVGQGSATFVEFQSGERILIDGGGSSYSKSTVGPRVIAPFLWDKGIQSLHLIAITHPDADHYNGLDFVAQHFAPKQIWVKNVRGHDEKYRRIIGSMQHMNGSVTVPYDGMIFGETETSLECIANIGNWKDTSFEADKRNQANNGLILSVKTSHFTALFPGDIGENAEKALVSRAYNLNADIVLSPHHGSKTSNSETFLTASSPQFLIVSAGGTFKGRFPHYQLAPFAKSTISPF